MTQQQVGNPETTDRLALASTVKIVESIQALPAVPTQNWCDLACAALLPLGKSVMAAVMLGQIDDHGKVVRQEATGVAGATTAQVGTNIGRIIELPSTILMDTNDPSLAGLRASMAQGKELGWSPGALITGQAKLGMADELGIGNWRQGTLGRRWARAAGGVEATSLSLLLGAVVLPGATTGRVLVVEIGVRERTMPGNTALAVLEATLPSLARRAFAAVGPEPSDSTHWLTTREQTILNHLLTGKSVREIAEELGRSPHTVHDHVKALHRKLGANSRGELIARALGHLQQQYAEPAAEAATESGKPSEVAKAR